MYEINPELASSIGRSVSAHKLAILVAPKPRADSVEGESQRQHQPWLPATVSTPHSSTGSRSKPAMRWCR